MNQRMILRALSISALIVLVAAGLFLMFDHGLLRLNYPSDKRFPIQGIDVSHHQGEIDWAKVAAQKNIRFAFIKATEGGDFRDPRFADNWQNSRKVGLIRGAYHFFTFCRSGRDQAKNFLAIVPYEEGALPITIDLEFGGNCKKEPSLDELVSEIWSFRNEVQKTHPQKPIFYVTPEFFEHYLKDNTSRFPPHYLWLRNIYYEPSQKNCERWAIWQFANRGILEGISVPVDLNALCPTQSELLKLFAHPHFESVP